MSVWFAGLCDCVLEDENENDDNLFLLMMTAMMVDYMYHRTDDNDYDDDFHVAGF